jgi:hypothetical protein
MSDAQDIVKRLRAHGMPEGTAFHNPDSIFNLAADEIQRLRSELLAAREDARRLDWLEAEHKREIAWLEVHEPTTTMPHSLFRSNMPITRAAIDSAMKGDAA